MQKEDSFVNELDVKIDFNELPIKDIPILGLGTYKLKTMEEINYSMKYAIESGYRMFDTARLYKNEHLISNFIKEILPQYKLSRRDIWITTKIPYYTMLDDGESGIRKSIEDSIKYFGGYIDLLLIHASNPNDILTWQIMREYQKLGKIRYLGISNYNSERLEKFIDGIRNQNKSVKNKIDILDDEIKYIYANQIELNPYLYRVDLISRCYDLGIKIIAYGSLYKATEPVIEIAKKYNVSNEIILLQWAVQKGIIVIPMSRNKEHIHQNFSNIYNHEMKSKYLDKTDINILDNLHEGYTRFKKHL